MVVAVVVACCWSHGIWDFVLVLVLYCGPWFPFLFSNHFAEEETFSWVLCGCLCSVSRFTVPWFGLRSMIVVFPGHNLLLVHFA